MPFTQLKPIDSGLNPEPMTKTSHLDSPPGRNASQLELHGP